MLLSSPNVQAVRAYLLDLQDRICQALEHQEATGGFNLYAKPLNW